MKGKRRRREGSQSRHGRGGVDPGDGTQITTPEGDEVVVASVRYRVSEPLAVAVLLNAVDDFDLAGDPDSLEAWDPEGDESLEFIWLETDPEAPPTKPTGRRILANVILTGTTLEAEAMSQRRLDYCRVRLEDLLTGALRLLETRTKTLEQAMMEVDPTEFEGFFVPPPEQVREIEEEMLLDWLDASIPVLGGLTPREAVKTPEGREKVLALIEGGARRRQAAKRIPGMMTPDYRKAIEILGLDEERRQVGQD